MIDPVHPNALGQLMLFREMAPAFDVAKYFPWEEIPSEKPRPSPRARAKRAASRR